MTPTWLNQVLIGDAVERLRGFPDGSIDCAISSPPFFLVRDYGVAGQIGREGHVDGWVAAMLEVGAELARVLTSTGSLWLEIGDTYSRHDRFGARRKSLLLAPERLMIELTKTGWIVRERIVWHKTNPLPRGIDDRVTPSHSLLYHLVRQPAYFFDRDAIRLPVAASHLLGRDPGDVWSLPTRRGLGGHPATFPEELVKRPLLASCPEAVCTRCGRAWRRSTFTERLDGAYLRSDQYQLRFAERYRLGRRRGAFVRCGCQAPTRPGRVLDPFCGTGTVCAVAAAHGRDWVGIELKAEYADIARQRLGPASAA